MYCPVCGDEFVNGITRCPEHDVELVDEPPEFDEPLSWVDRFNDRAVLRVTFIVFLVAAVVYAISGSTTAILFQFTQSGNDYSFEKAQLAQQIQTASFPVAIAALGILAGALLLRAYISITEESETPGVEHPRESAIGLSPISQGVMRLLFALSVVFALMWAGTGIATSQDQIERRSIRFGTEPEDQPTDTYLLLLMLNYVAYTGGVTSLAIMGAGLMAGAHRRMSTSTTQSE